MEEDEFIRGIVESAKKLQLSFVKELLETFRKCSGEEAVFKVLVLSQFLKLTGEDHIHLFSKLAGEEGEDLLRSANLSAQELFDTLAMGGTLKFYNQIRGGKNGGQ